MGLLDFATADPAAAPGQPSQDEIIRRLAAAGQLPEQQPDYQPPLAASATLPASATAPSATAAPSISGLGAASTAAPQPSTPPPFDSASTTSYGGTPAQPRAPKPPASIPGFESYDPGAALSNVDAGRHGYDGQPAQFHADQAQTYGASGSNPATSSLGTLGTAAQTTQDASTPSAASAPATAASGQSKPPGQKSYSIGDDGSVQFDPAGPVQSVLDAFHDDAIDGATAQTSLSNAKRLASAHSDLGKFLQDHPQLSSAAEGLSTGGAFLAGGAGAATAATPLNAMLGMATAPIAWATVPAAEALEFLGGGMLASWAKRKGEDRLTS